MAGATDANALLLNISADNSKLIKALDQVNARLDQAGIDMPKKAKKAAAAMEGAFAMPNIGKALDKVFDSSRLKVFDTASERIGLTGSALEALGGAGLAAAAALAAVGVGLEGARKADEYAATISKAAQVLHVTTDQLQQYREATRLAGGDTAGADAALAAFSSNLGKAQEGLKKGQRAFIALGFTPAQIKGFTDVDSALRAVTEKLQGLSGVQKDAIVDQLGLTGMKPLIEGGLDKMDELKQEAVSLGLVMDAGAVARGRELNEQFETLDKVIDVQIKQALVDLGPVLLDIMKLVAGIAGAFGGWVDGFKSVGHRSSVDLAKEAQADTAAIAKLTAQRDRGGLFGGLDAFSKAALDRAQAELPRVQAELKARALAAAKDTPPIPKSALTDTSAQAAAQKAAQQAVERQELALKAQLAAATESGDVSEIQGLKDKIELLAKVKGYMSAGLTQAAAEIAAGRDMAVIQKARADAQAAAVDGLRREAALKAAVTSGDQATVDQLQREGELEKLTADYQKQGQTYEEAHASALADANAEQDAQNAKRALAIADMHDQATLQAASLAGDQQTVDLIQHRLDLEKLVEQYRAQGKVQADAEKAAAEDLLKIDAARAAQKEQLLGQMQQEYALTLAEAKGDAAAVQALQQAARIAAMVKSLMAAMPGLDEASATDIATQAQAVLAKASHTAANDFETLNAALGNIASAFESHDWGALTNSLANAINALKTAFGPDGTLAGKVGAVAGVANQIGGLIGGKAGGAISGAAGGAMIGMTLGGPVGAALGGLGGLISGLLGNDHTRDIQAQQAAQQALQQQAQATTAALEKLQQEQGDYASALEAFYTASGQSQKALDQQRADELKGLDDATAAIKKQTYAWDDYNSALQTANDNITSARDALKQAYQTDAAALQATIDAVDTAKADLVAAYQAEASALGDVITRFQQFKATLTAFRASLDMGDLGAGGPGGQYRAAASAFQTTLAGALTGDDSAMGGFTQAAQNFLTASKANAASQVDYLRDVAKVKSATDRVGAMSDDQVSIAQKQLDVMTQQVGQLVDLNDKTQTVATATAALKAAQDQAITASQQLETERAQVSGLVNINESVLTVAQAIANLQAALLAQASLSPPPATPPAGGPPGGTYTSTNGDYAAYVMGNPDLLAGFNNPTTGFANPVFKQTLIAAGLPATMAGFGQFQWEHAGALENRPVRPFAKGGSFTLPGLAGIDRNLLSLNGHPIARVSAGEQMTITPKALGLAEPGSGGDDLQLVRFGIEQLAVRMGSMDARQQRWDKLGVPVRGVDPNQPLPVRVA